jgi:hypothetical protein
MGRASCPAARACIPAKVAPPASIPSAPAPQKRIIEERMKYINQKFGKGTIGKLSDAPMKV